MPLTALCCRYSVFRFVLYQVVAMSESPQR